MNEDELTDWGGSPRADRANLSQAFEFPAAGWLEARHATTRAAEGASARSTGVSIDADQGVPFDLAELWRRLGATDWQLREVFETADRLYAIVEQQSSPDRRADPRALAMIEQVLRGQSAKAVAIDLQRSDSTVAFAIKRRLQTMGLRCNLRALPLILVIAARAACSPSCRVRSGRIARFPGEAAKRWVVSVNRPHLPLPDRLSDAERSVLLQLLDGKTYVQIARHRCTSTRTVANQIGAVFRKLGVSGYGATLHLLMSSALEVRMAESP